MSDETYPAPEELSIESLDDPALTHLSRTHLWFENAKHLENSEAMGAKKAKIICPGCLGDKIVIADGNQTPCEECGGQGGVHPKEYRNRRDGVRNPRPGDKEVLLVAAGNGCGQPVDAHIPDYYGDIDAARLFAESAHEGQFRRFAGEPYVQHPIRIAGKAARLGMSKNAVIAALLHDVVEDCDVKLDEIEFLFGDDVRHMVDLLSERKATEGNRAERKKVFRERIRDEGDEEVQTLKLLDVIDNAKSLMGHDPGFWHSAAREESTLALQDLDKAHMSVRKELQKLLKG